MAGKDKKSSRGVRVTKKGGSGTDATALATLLDVDKQAKKLRYHLGLRYDEEENEWVERDYNLLNEEGVHSLVGFLRSQVDQNQILSVYEDGQIVNLMQTLHEAVARDIATNWPDYGIKNKAVADKAVEIVTNNFYSVYLRALDGKSLELYLGALEEKSETKKEPLKDDGGSRWPL